MVYGSVPSNAGRLAPTGGRLPGFKFLRRGHDLIWKATFSLQLRSIGFVPPMSDNETCLQYCTLFAVTCCGNKKSDTRYIHNSKKSI